MEVVFARPEEGRDEAEAFVRRRGLHFTNWGSTRQHLVGSMKLMMSQIRLRSMEDQYYPAESP